MLTSKQRAKLRKTSQTINPLIQVGINEVHQQLITSVNQGFNNRELLKIRIRRQNKEDKKIIKILADDIAVKTESEIVGIIGATVILYKKNINEKLNIL